MAATDRCFGFAADRGDRGLSAEAEVGAFGVSPSMASPMEAVSGLLEGVESAGDVLGAEFGELSLDAVDVAFEFLFDRLSDGLPALLGLFERGAGQSDGA